MNDQDFYHRYLDCLNLRAFDHLASYVTDDVTHNGHPLGLEGYRTMIESDLEAIPDLRFEAELVVADAQHIAARLRFDCRPAAKFRDLDVDGRRVVFHEHAIYRLVDNRIATVWSVIDLAEIARQIE